MIFLVSFKYFSLLHTCTRENFSATNCGAYSERIFMTLYYDLSRISLTVNQRLNWQHHRRKVLRLQRDLTYDVLLDQRLLVAQFNINFHEISNIVYVYKQRCYSWSPNIKNISERVYPCVLP